jgi:hypothetical protein
MFTRKELDKLQDLVFDKIDTDDFEYQDEDYQKFMIDLEAKISDLRLKDEMNKNVAK